MALNFKGKYKLESSENWSEFLKESGVGLIQRNLMATLAPPVDFTQDGDSYTIIAVTAVKNFELKFDLGVEFDDKTIAGKACKSTVTRDGNILTHVQKTADGEETKTTRELTEDGKLIVVISTSVGKISCKRIYSKEK